VPVRFGTAEQTTSKHTRPTVVPSRGLYEFESEQSTCLILRAQNHLRNRGAEHDQDTVPLLRPNHPRRRGAEDGVSCTYSMYAEPSPRVRADDDQRNRTTSPSEPSRGCGAD
jgi:hypothetical protein